MSNRKADVLIKYLHTLSHVGFSQYDEKVLKVIDEIEKELDLQQVKKIPVKDPNKALVIAIKDCSGSVGIWENHVFKEYYDLALQEIKNKYKDVDEIFIQHHTEARIATKEDFFKNGESGGTIVSSAIREAKKHLNTDREVIIIQFSDGDNLISDCSRVEKLLNDDILPNVKYFKYIEANQYNRHSTLIEKCYKGIKSEKFNYDLIKERNDALRGLRLGEELDNLN